MREFFKRLWEIEMNRLEFALDYWYIAVLLIAIGIITICTTKIKN